MKRKPTKSTIKWRIKANKEVSEEKRCLNGRLELDGGGGLKEEILKRAINERYQERGKIA